MNRNARRAMEFGRHTASRPHGRPMLCPNCGNDIYLGEPHLCPEKMVTYVTGILTFYGYNAMNRCCRDWMLLGWPQVGGEPKGLEGSDRGIVAMECPRCQGGLHFRISHPDMVTQWDTRTLGKPDPPAIVGGRIVSRV